MLSVVVAFLVAAALFPLGLAGPRVSAWFPSGNPVGWVGGQLDNYLRSSLGLGSAAVPLALVAAGATGRRWWSKDWIRRIWILTAGLMLLPPMAAFLLGEGPRMHGYIGSATASPVRAAVGWLGAWLLVAAGTLGVGLAFNLHPIRAAGGAFGGLPRGSIGSERRQPREHNGSRICERRGPRKPGRPRPRACPPSRRLPEPMRRSSKRQRPPGRRARLRLLPALPTRQTPAHTQRLA